MAHNRCSGSLTSPRVDVLVDTGNTFLDHTVDGFLKIGAVAATRAAAEETFQCLGRGEFPKHKLEDTLKRMFREGACWGTVAGVYVGMERGIERIRGTRDWKSAMLSGALSGALISAATNNGRDKVVMHTITGGAIATAAEFLNCLT